MTKILWAPLVDRDWSERFGRRKKWIVPMQVCIALTAFAAALVADRGRLAQLLALVGLMNLFSATMDIAVDGLAVDLLAENELGTGNITQVVGYKFGTLTSGGLLAVVLGDGRWPWLFVAMGVLTLGVCAATTLFPEPRKATPPTVETGAYRTTETPDEASPDLRRIGRLLLDTLKVPGMGAAGRARDLKNRRAVPRVGAPTALKPAGLRGHTPRPVAGAHAPTGAARRGWPCAARSSSSSAPSARPGRAGTGRGCPSTPAQEWVLMQITLLGTLPEARRTH